jgi:hypothetical protein
MAAKTYADLDRLVTDLPGGEPSGARPAARPRRPRPWLFPLLPLALIAAIVVGSGHHPWFLIPLVAFFVIRPLVWRSWGWGVWGCGPRGGTRGGTRA